MTTLIVLQVLIYLHCTSRLDRTSSTFLAAIFFGGLKRAVLEQHVTATSKFEPCADSVIEVTFIVQLASSSLKLFRSVLLKKHVPQWRIYFTQSDQMK